MNEYFLRILKRSHDSSRKLFCIHPRDNGQKNLMNWWIGYSAHLKLRILFVYISECEEMQVCYDIRVPSWSSNILWDILVKIVADLSKLVTFVFVCMNQYQSIANVMLHIICHGIGLILIWFILDQIWYFYHCFNFECISLP